MLQRAYRCVVELRIHHVCAPGTRLPDSECVYIVIDMFNMLQRTRFLIPCFPLLFDDDFVFEKVFMTGIYDGNVFTMLKETPVGFDLRQTTHFEFGGKVLAYYESNVFDLLFDKNRACGPVMTKTQDIFLRRTIDFPGPPIRMKLTTSVSIHETPIDKLSEMFQGLNSFCCKSTVPCVAIDPPCFQHNADCSHGERCLTYNPIQQERQQEQSQQPFDCFSTVTSVSKPLKMSPSWSTRHILPSRTREVSRSALCTPRTSASSRKCCSNPIDSLCVNLSWLQESGELSAPLQTSTPIAAATATCIPCEELSDWARRQEELSTLNNLLHQIWHLFYPDKHHSCPWNHCSTGVRCNCPSTPWVDTNVAASYSSSWNNLRFNGDGWCRCDDCEAQIVGETFELKNRVDLITASTSTMMTDLEEVKELSLPTFVLTGATIGYMEPVSTSIEKLHGPVPTESSKQCGLPGLLDLSTTLPASKTMDSKKDVLITKTLSGITWNSMSERNSTNPSWRIHGTDHSSKQPGIPDLQQSTSISAELLSSEVLPPPPSLPMGLRYVEEPPSAVQFVSNPNSYPPSTYDDASAKRSLVTANGFVNEVRSTPCDKIDSRQEQINQQFQLKPAEPHDLDSVMPSLQVQSTQPIPEKNSTFSKRTPHRDGLPPQIPTWPRSGLLSNAVNHLGPVRSLPAQNVHSNPISTHSTLAQIASLSRIENDSDWLRSSKQISSPNDRIPTDTDQSVVPNKPSSSKLLWPANAIRIHTTESPAFKLKRTHSNLSSSDDNMVLSSERSTLTPELQYTVVYTPRKPCSPLNSRQSSSCTPKFRCLLDKRSPGSRLTLSRSENVNLDSTSTLLQSQIKSANSTLGDSKLSAKPFSTSVLVYEGELNTAGTQSSLMESVNQFSTTSFVVVQDTEPQKASGSDGSSSKKSVNEIEPGSEHVTLTESNPSDAAVQTKSTQLTKSEVMVNSVAQRISVVRSKSSSQTIRSRENPDTQKTHATVNSVGVSQSAYRTEFQPTPKSKSKTIGRTSLTVNILPYGAPNRSESDRDAPCKQCLHWSPTPLPVQQSKTNPVPREPSRQMTDPNCPIHGLLNTNPIGLKAFREALAHRSKVSGTSRSAYQTIYPADRLRAPLIRLVMTPEQYRHMVEVHNLKASDHRTHVISQSKAPTGIETGGHNVLSPSPRECKQTSPRLRSKCDKLKSTKFVRSRLSHSSDRTPRVNRSVPRCHSSNTKRRVATKISRTKTKCIPTFFSADPDISSESIAVEREPQKRTQPCPEFISRNATPALVPSQADPLRSTGQNLRETILQTLSMPRSELVMA